MSISLSILNIFYFFNEVDESVKSPLSNEPIKSRFGLNATVPKFNEKTCPLVSGQPTLMFHYLGGH